MDLTLDSKDLLLETLSQGSSTTRSRSPLSQQYKRQSALAGLLSSHSAAGAAASSSIATSSHVDEAFKRLGQKLSLQAHGGNGDNNDDDAAATAASTVTARRRRRKLRLSSTCAFEAMPENSQATSALQRTCKVAKTTYADHGLHHSQQHQQQQNHDDEYQQSTATTTKLHLLRKLTMDAEECYRQWQHRLPEQLLHEEQIGSQSLAAARQTPQQQSFIDADGSHLHQYHASPLSAYQSLLSSSSSRSRGRYAGANANAASIASHPAKTSLLSAVMEAQHESTPSIRQGLAEQSPSGSISTKESAPSQQQQHQQQRKYHQQSIQEQYLQQQQQPSPSLLLQRDHALPRGACLTQPSARVANDGLDNADGNLIVYEHDVIQVPPQSLHTLNELSTAAASGVAVPSSSLIGKSQQSTAAEFRIQSCLGQGTFAQVFQCLHVGTGKLMALKVVKNKQAYTRQATVEIDVFRSLQQGNVDRDYMVSLEYFFMYKNHLCLVFEKLGLNLYEVLKKRQFRGLPLAVVRNIMQQIVVGIKDLTSNNVLHCDLKPENILLETEAVAQAVINAGESTMMTAFDKSTSVGMDPDSADRSDNSNNSHANDATTRISSPQSHKIKIIDFGSACFEGYTAHTYIQSRFYRCPEVLIGLPYDSGIDMWSLGCVVAELYLGLPILPGCHEHDQLGRIQEMIGGVPDWMLDQGSKSTKYYVKYRPNVTPVSDRGSPMTSGGGNNRTPSPWTPVASASPSAPGLPQWRLKTQQEFINSLSQNEINKKGGLAKLEKQPGHRYFKSQKLIDIVGMHAQTRASENKEMLSAFIHLLYGILEPDPWKRMTALQVSQHPFLTGETQDLRKKSFEQVMDPKEENQANLVLGLYWPVPFDPAILRRKLLNVQRQREKQQSVRRGTSSRPSSQASVLAGQRIHTDARGQSLVQAANGRISPPDGLNNGGLSGLSQRLLATDTQQRLGPVSVSLSDLVHENGTNTSFGPDITSKQVASSNVLPVLVTGPQSFGVHDDLRRPMVAGDFAFALHRPGIVPGAGSALGMDGEASVGSFQYGGRDSVSSSRMHAQASLDAMHSPTMPRPVQHTPQSLTSSMMSLNTSHFPTTSLASSHVNGGQHSMHGNYVGHSQEFDFNQHQAMDQPPQHQQQQLQYLQQQQLQQQQLQQHQLLLQQQQQQQQQQLMYGMPPSQSQVPQQPLYPMSDASGRIYYVTTSITGQPVILKPVGPDNLIATQQSPYFGATLPQSIPERQQFVLQEHSAMPQPAFHPRSDYLVQGNGVIQGSGQATNIHMQQHFHQTSFAAQCPPPPHQLQQQQQQMYHLPQQQPYHNMHMQYAPQIPQQQPRPESQIRGRYHTRNTSM